jgi:hypothetical protein
MFCSIFRRPYNVTHLQSESLMSIWYLPQLVHIGNFFSRTNRDRFHNYIFDMGVVYQRINKLV